MTSATNTRGLIATVLVLLALAACRPFEEDAARPAAPSSSAIPSAMASGVENEGFLSGRITAIDGTTYEGRLRWGGDEEAFWGDYFNGSKSENPWVGHVPPERLPMERRLFEIFGIEMVFGERPADLDRPFMARFGDIARIGASGFDVLVTLKSGSVFNLDRLAAGDIDDGVRVWDGGGGVVDLDTVLIRTIEFLPTAWPGSVPDRLHGTVRTGHGEYSGFLQWNRELCVGSDKLDGITSDGAEQSLRFDLIRSISRHSSDSALVTLLDGREIVLSGTRETGRGNLGIYVDDRRYGRVLISWDAFERVDFSPGGSGPAYGDYPPGRPLNGSVTSRAGRRLTGRLVFDLDESEITEMLDAPSQGVDYTIPFGLIASIAHPGPEERGPQRVRVTLHDGEELQLERSGDLAESNAGVLVFVAGRQQPEYVPWAEVERLDFDRPPTMYPP